MTTIFYEAFPVAQLEDRNDIRLTYEPGWEARTSAFPISLAMPMRSGSFGADTVLPWLANLLPEAHLSEIGQRLKVSPQDIIGLLLRLGRDTAGAFSIGEPRKDGNNFRVIPDKLSLERILNALPERPFLVGENGVSMSLAGVQDKLPVFVDADGRFAIAMDGTPSTHILKPDIRRLAGSVQNEALCMTLAGLCGLEVAEVTTGRAGARNYLLVKRCDRIEDGEGVVRRIHQEDFCQLLGLFPSGKYERSGFGTTGGASLRQMFNALATYVSPAERLRLRDAVIFNILVCNSDSHAKNYSVLIGAGGTAKLAPLYDIMCAAVYQQVDQSLPQEIGSKTNGNELHRKDWEAFAKVVGLSPVATARRVTELAMMVIEYLDQAALAVNAMDAGTHDVIQKSTRAIHKRCENMTRHLS